MYINQCCRFIASDKAGVNFKSIVQGFQFLKLHNADELPIDCFAILV